MHIYMCNIAPIWAPKEAAGDVAVYLNANEIKYMSYK